jgi:hypothetical protein
MDAQTLGVFPDQDAADRAINELEERGYGVNELSIITREVETKEEGGRGEHVTKGAVSGATTGGVIGGIAGLLVGLGAIAIPGIGGIMIGGPLAAALGLTGAAASTVSGAATGAVAGGLIGALVGIGVPEDKARVYEERVKEGGILLGVPHTHITEQTEVESLMEDLGADDITTVMS